MLIAFENLKNGWKKYENKWITNEHRITKKNFVIFSSYVCDGIWKMLTGTSEEDSEQNTNTMKNAMHAIERERDKNGKISVIITIKKQTESRKKKKATAAIRWSIQKYQADEEERNVRYSKYGVHVDYPMMIFNEQQQQQQ